MTVLNFHLSDAAVYVVADTLATNDTYKPALFTTKVFPVPHWNGLICGTGCLGFILDWFQSALGGMLATDLVHLDEFTPSALRGIHARRGGNGSDNPTTTIYHFGLDGRDGLFKGFAYRSTTGFESEPLIYGTYTKPYLNIREDGVWSFPQDFVEFCKKQRDQQDLFPVEDRVFIGGQIVAWMMERVEIDGVGTTVRTSIVPAYEFPDADAAMEACIDALPPQGEA